MDRFKFINFTPRTELQLYANRALEILVDKMPSDAAIRAEAVHTGDGFHFSVRAHSTAGTFASAATAVPDAHSKHDRMWQCSAIDKIIADITDQIRLWRHGLNTNTKPKILIVDDDEPFLFLLRSICEGVGFEVSTGANGNEALEFLTREKFNLIISDIRMPIMDGVALLEAIKREKIEVPVIMMSGYSMYGRDELEKRNAVTLIEKPFTKRQIEETVLKYA